MAEMPSSSDLLSWGEFGRGDTVFIWLSQAVQALPIAIWMFGAQK